MVEEIYCIFDNKAGIGIRPLMTSRNDVVPVREFQAAVNNTESIFNKHPEDFDLVRCGKINLETLEIYAQEPPTTVAKAIDLLAKPV